MTPGAHFWLPPGADNSEKVGLAPAHHQGQKRAVLANLIMEEMAKEEMLYSSGLFSDAGTEFIALNAFAFSRVTVMASRKMALAGLLRTK